MSGTWINAKLELPKNHQTVLAVKELKSGQRDICIAYCIPEYTRKDYATGETVTEPYWVCQGNNNIIYWMPLPKIPEK